MSESNTTTVPEEPVPPTPAPLPDAASILAFMQGTAAIVRDLAVVTRDVSQQQTTAPAPAPAPPPTPPTLKLEAPSVTEFRGQVVRDFDFELSAPGDATFNEPAEPTKQVDIGALVKNEAYALGKCKTERFDPTNGGRDYWIR